MESDLKSTSYRQFSIFLALSVILFNSLQLYIIYTLKGDALIIILSINFVLIILIYYKSYIQNLPTFLLMINFIPLIYLDNNFHYDLNLLLLSSLPLVLLCCLSVLQYIGNESSFEFSIKYLFKPILLFSLFFFIIALSGVVLSQKVHEIVHQLFHLMLYFLVFPISYFFTQRKYYFSIFTIILLIYLMISLEYILLNQFILGYRFVTFQSGTFPLIIGPVFAFILYTRNLSQKIFAIILLSILIWGAFITVTRALWIATIISIILTLVFYLKLEFKYSYKKIFFYLLFLSLPLFFISDSGSVANKNAKYEQVEYKAKSIANPMEDGSFIMRFELGYYSFQRFLESPIIGSGLGDFLKYKIFSSINRAPQFYIDNSWFYILWKGGLIGIILFIWMYIRFIRSAFYIVKHTQNPKVKYFCIGLLAGIISLCVLGLFSPLLIKYKTIAIIALVFAYVQFEQSKISNSINKITHT